MIKRKQCPNCKKWKQANLKFFSSLHKLGYCRECKQSIRKIYDRKYREKHPDLKKAENKKCKNLRAQFIKRYFKKYPERLRAKFAVLKAKKSGRLIQKGCAVCGEIETVAHHPNYKYPLKVVWLCRKHHKQLHAGIIKIYGKKSSGSGVG